MAAGLAMMVSYVSVIIVVLMIVGCIMIMKTERELQKERKRKGDVGWELDEGIGWLTVMIDKRNGGRAGSLRGTAYSLSESERLGSGAKADTVIAHPAVEKLHVSLTYKRPGKILVQKIRDAAVSTSRKEGELMDGDRLILGTGDNRIELQLSFINHSDIAAAGKCTEESEPLRGGRRAPRR